MKIMNRGLQTFNEKFPEDITSECAKLTTEDGVHSLVYGGGGR